MIRSLSRGLGLFVVAVVWFFAVFVTFVGLQLIATGVPIFIVSVPALAAVTIAVIVFRSDRRWP